MYNHASYADASFVNSFQFLNLSQHLISTIQPYGNDQEISQLLTADFILMEPGQFQAYNSAFVADNAYGFTARTLYNYLYYRVLNTYADYLPAVQSSSTQSSFQSSSAAEKEEVKERLISKLEWNLHGKWAPGDTKEDLLAREILLGHRLVRPRVGPSRVERVIYPKSLREDDGAYTYSDLYCIFGTLDQMPYANARVYLDQAFSNVTARNRLREVGGGLRGEGLKNHFKNRFKNAGSRGAGGQRGDRL